MLNHSLPATSDVVVVGGGAVGVSTAYALARRGVAVVVIERGRLGSGASAGTACMVTLGHSERLASPAALREGMRNLFDSEAPVALHLRPAVLPWLARFAAASLRGAAADEGTAHLRKLSRRSLDAHRRWNGEVGTGLVEEGTLNVWTGPDGFAARDAMVREQRAAGLSLTELSAADIRELEPLVLDAVCGVLSTDDAHVDSLQFVERIAEGARSQGSVICEGAEVLHVDRRGGGIRVDTTRGVITCSQLVLAAGIWSRRFEDDLGIGLPLTSAKGYHVEFDGLGRQARRPIYLSEDRVVATPLAGRLRLAGTLEIGTDPDLINQPRIEAVRRAGERRLAGLAGQSPSRVWMGLRPMSVDGMPLIGPVPNDPRVILAVGHGMLGITLAPITAELVADHVTGVADGIDPLLDPGRFRSGFRDGLRDARLRHRQVG